MPRPAAIKAANAALNLAGKHFLVVGGTGGIGEATAVALAAMHPESLTIAGRNEAAGESVLAKLRAVQPEANFAFERCDVSRIKDVKRFAAAFSSAHPELDCVVITAGFLSMAGRTETEEGIDVKLATHYYGRWAVINELLPLLEKAAEKDDRNVRVVTVLAAAKGGPVPAQDLDLKTTFSIKRAADAASTYNDLLVEELVARHPRISAAHIYPGGVNTNIMDKLPLPLRLPAKLISPLLTPADVCGQMVAHVATTKELPRGSWGLYNEKGDRVQPTKHQTAENRKLVWEHTEDLVGKAAAA